MRRVLVTGASGQLGRVVVTTLLEAGIAVTALDLSAPEQPAADRVVVGSAAQPETVRRALADVEAVIHAAALPSPEHWPATDVFSTNTQSTFVVLNQAGEAGIRRAVIASSFSALGFAFARRPAPAYVPVDEDHPYLVEDPYGLSKQVDEATAAMMARRHGQRIVALRFPFLGDQRRLTWQAGLCRDRPLWCANTLWGYLDVRDAARACLLGLTADGVGLDVVGVAAPETLAPYPTEDLLDAYFPHVPRHAALPGRATPYDTTAARDRLGFQPRYVFPIAPRAFPPPESLPA